MDEDRRAWLAYRIEMTRQHVEKFRQEADRCEPDSNGRNNWTWMADEAEDRLKRLLEQWEGTKQ